MLRVALKGLAGHKIRLLLTVVAIALGVAFVAGTFVFTDTIDATLSTLFDDIFAGIDVEVRSDGDDDVGFAAARDRFPAAVLDDVLAVDGVSDAAGIVFGYAQMIGPDGEPIQRGGAPTFGFSWPDGFAAGGFRLRDGRPPQAPGEAVIDAATSAQADIGVGDVLEVLFEGAPETFTVVGTAGFGNAASPAGATAVLFDLATARRVLATGDTFDSISVIADDGVAADALARRIQEVLPGGVEAVTAAEAAQSQADALESQLSVLDTVLLVFAAIAVFVGAFIIQNTFRIMIAQRTRELALLRIIGATGSQVTRMMLLEAAVVGLVASLAGLVAGIGLAFGLRAVFELVGADFPPSPVQILPRTIVVAVVVGLAVTIASAILPARRAARIAPIAALLDAATPPSARSLRRRAAAGGAIAAAGFGAVVAGILAGEVLVVGAGAGALFIGVTILSPALSRPVAEVLGALPARLRGLPGALARENVKRVPRRTAATASALTIGITLVVAMAILSASVKVTIGRILEESFRADFVVQQTSSGFGSLTGISPEIADRLAGLPAVDDISRVRVNLARIDGSTAFVGAAEPNVTRVVDIEMEAGGFADLTGQTVAIDAGRARDEGLGVGDSLTVSFSRTGEVELEIVALFEADGIQAPYLISLDAYEANFVERLDFAVYVILEEGVDPQTGLEAIESVTDEFATASVLDAAGIRRQAEEQINAVLGIVVALLMLAILISLIGITNTLTLSVIERTREIGLLRAVGMSRSGIRATIRWEAMIIAVFGALLGVVLGVAIGWVVILSLADDGLRFALPVGQIVAVVAAAAVAGVLAAVLPAIRASRLDVLEAIAHE